MRRALLVLVVLVVVAGAFAAGAAIFRDRGDRDIVESQVHCGDGDTGKECIGFAEEEKRGWCKPPDKPDAVRLTIIYESDGEEYGRRTWVENC